MLVLWYRGGLSLLFGVEIFFWASRFCILLFGIKIVFFLGSTRACLFGPRHPVNVKKRSRNQNEYQKHLDTNKQNISIPTKRVNELQTHPEFAQPRLSRVKARSSPARGYKFGCVCSYMASHEDAGVVTGHIGTKTPKFVPPRWERPSFDPTQTGLCKFGWVWSSLKESPFSLPIWGNIIRPLTCGACPMFAWYNHNTSSKNSSDKLSPRSPSSGNKEGTRIVSRFALQGRISKRVPGHPEKLGVK